MKKKSAATYFIVIFFLVIVMIIQADIKDGQREMTDRLENKMEVMEKRVDSLQNSVDSLRNDLEGMELIGDVTTTMYHPSPYQTDDTPGILADGTKIDIHRAGEYKFIAVSRDLHRIWGGPLGFGDRVYIKGMGMYEVRDVMHWRWEKRVDVLLSPGAEPFKYDNLPMIKVS